MEFFSDAVDMLETIVVALGAGLQTWGEFKKREQGQAITREFINRRLMRRSGIKRIHFGMSSITAGGGPRPPSNELGISFLCPKECNDANKKWCGTPAPYRWTRVI